MLKLNIFLILTIVLLPSVFAIGISRPHINNDMASVNNNQEYQIPFTIQNSDNSNKTITFYAETQDPMKINGGTRIFQQTFVMGPLSSQSINLNFKSSQNAIFKVKYSVKEGGSGSGISMSFGAGDYFYIKVGNSTVYKNFDLNLVYSGFILQTEALDISSVTDLVISSGAIDVDFTGQNINLTGFKPEYVVFADKSVYLNTTVFPQFNKKAKISFYNIKSIYTVYKDGNVCSLSQCKDQTYQSKRVQFESNPFAGRYSIIDRNPDPAPVTSTPAKSGGSGGAGGILPRTNYTKVNNTKVNDTVVIPVEKTVVSDKIEPVVEKVDENVNTGNTNNIPIVQKKPVIIPEVKQPDSTDIVNEQAKVLLIRSIVLSFILLVLSGILLFYVKINGVQI